MPGTAVARALSVRRLVRTTCLVLAGSVPAQGPALVERIEAPMLYLALQPAAAGRPAATAQQLTVQRLLTDPALERLVGADPASAAAVALGFLRGVLGRVAGEIELVLLGIVPAGDG